MKEIAELEELWIKHQILMPMLPILEHPYPDVLNEIGPESCITQNLLADIVEHSLNFPSRHWALSAVTWIENGFPINNSICKRLLNISKDKYDPQKLRHKSFTQARRWQRASGT